MTWTSKTMPDDANTDSLVATMVNPSRFDEFDEIPEGGVNVDEIVDDEGKAWHQTMNALLWTKAFMALHGGKLPNEGNMLAWFANAIMAGWDHHAWRYGTPAPAPVAERPWERDGWCNEAGECWGNWDKAWHICKPLLLNPLSSVPLLPRWALPLPESKIN